MLDSFIDMYGETSDNVNRSKTLIDAVRSAGGTAFKKNVFYGGNLGPEAKEYEIKGAPGTYDFARMPKSLVKKLKPIALDNRAREIIKVYLQQGGRDAYAPHEGIRSIKDMDLEHIQSLEGANPGVDNPSNWVFSSTELNRLKSNRDLTGPGSSIEKLAQGPREFQDQDFTAMGRTFRDFTGGDEELEQELADALGGNPAGNTRQRGVFGRTRYSNLSNEQKQELRDTARDYGMSEREISLLFPDPQPNPDTRVVSSDYESPAGSRIGGMAYKNKNNTKEKHPSHSKKKIKKKIFLNNYINFHHIILIKKIKT